jgi:hypothetical protein
MRDLGDVTAIGLGVPPLNLRRARSDENPKHKPIFAQQRRVF